MGIEVGCSNGDCWVFWKVVFGVIGVVSKFIVGVVVKVIVE